MLELLKLRWRHGRPVIPDIERAELMSTFHGFPVLDESACAAGCQACVEVCPTQAITKEPLALDLGRCIFCMECERQCPSGAISFSSAYRLGASDREQLVVTSGLSADTYAEEAVRSRQEIVALFGRSLKLRQVSAAGCNGCELELAACGNVNFDMGRFGIDFVASPRHADGIVITGPVSRNMAPALMDAYASVPEPKLVIAVGACAISGGLFRESVELNREGFNQFKVDLFVPGCPPHPLTFIHALLSYLTYIPVKS